MTHRRRTPARPATPAARQHTDTGPASTPVGSDFCGFDVVNTFVTDDGDRNDSGGSADSYSGE